ncbi:hypothetical protein KC318_g679, partial [Hortaea werneckii]
DLEEDRKVSRSQAFKVSQAWGNVPYYETSARRRQNVSEVFVDVCRQIIRKDLSRARRDRGPDRPGYGGHNSDPKASGRRKRRRQRTYDDYDDDRRGGRSRCVIL